MYSKTSKTAMNVIKKTANGKIFKCNKCKSVHIEYKNLNFNFNKQDFEKFIKYFQDIDADFYEEINRNSDFKRKIVLPIGHQNFNILFDKKEWNEFKELLTEKSQNNCLDFIKNTEIFEVQHLN